MLIQLRSWDLSLESRNDVQWHPNDLKWFKVSWKQIFYQISLRTCNMSFYRFFGMLSQMTSKRHPNNFFLMLSRLRLSYLSLEPSNDLSDLKWPIETLKHNSFTNSPLGHVICLFIGLNLLNLYQNWVWRSFRGSKHKSDSASPPPNKNNKKIYYMPQSQIC